MSLPSPAPDRAAVVTGASSGIGAEIARELSRRGHTVVLVARTEARLKELADEIDGAGGTAHVVAMDLADRTARSSLADRVEALGLVPEILVNNAGFSTMGPVSKADPGSEMAMIEVDVVAVADLCTRFLPGMVERGRGAVLNVASTAAFQPLPGQAGYGAGKAFVLSYTQSLVGELRGSGVTATALCPGPVQTGFGERAGFSDEEAQDALPGGDVGRCRRGRPRRRRGHGQGPDGGHPRHRQPGRSRLCPGDAALAAAPRPGEGSPRPEVS